MYLHPFNYKKILKKREINPFIFYFLIVNVAFLPVILNTTFRLAEEVVYKPWFSTAF